VAAAARLAALLQDPAVHEKLEAKRGIDYDSHASYRFVERGGV
jgi:hypothetical protein